MSVDRINWVRIEGFRSIEDLTIHLDGLQVLIGENGAGKSTIVEAFELLRKAASESSFSAAVARRHGSAIELQREGSKGLKLSVGFQLDGAEKPAEYLLTLGAVADSPLFAIVEESLEPLFSRHGDSVVLWSPSMDAADGNARSARVPVGATALTSLWGAADVPSAVRRLSALLAQLDVRLPFDTRPRWAKREREQHFGPRGFNELESGEALALDGTNIASVFQRLKNQPRKYDWGSILTDLRAGLGADLRDVTVEVPTPGASVLKVTFDGLGAVPVSQLSDGQLSYLLLVALAHLEQPTSVLLFDEPELHLHPGLLVRVTWLFERIAKKFPVILATHADALLDALESAERAVRVLELNEQRATVMRRLSHEQLEMWLARFESVGELRREGLLSDVVERAQ